jgi:hypothetical protein
MFGLISPRFLTFTEIIKTYISIRVRFAVLCWLLWHFCLVDLVDRLPARR